MNKPPGLNAFLFPSSEPGTMGTVETPPILKILRPASLAMWLIIFCAEAMTVVTAGGSTHWLLLGLSTALFGGVHIQFWYEESEQGRRFHRTIERMRGRIYEDEATGLPNSRHFVFELRRQMMRSVRNGRGFSLVLTDFGGVDIGEQDQGRVLPPVAKSLRHAVGEGDFVAHLQGTIFGAIVLDDRERSAAEKADAVLSALGACIPLQQAGYVYPVVSLTGYEGELEVRDFLRRAQRDLLSARSRGMNQPRFASQRHAAA
ncbi:MAG TPA: GGDEF domain-containing protein [Tepidiformaceae bacterium]|nr:GGDEF domain-containing protein [Tepidiformaceae bacterium]